MSATWPVYWTAARRDADLASFTRQCSCCEQSFVEDIHLGRPRRYCGPCRSGCLMTNYTKRKRSPHWKPAA